MTFPDEIDAMQLGPDPDKLLVYHRQQLSAMLDGELSPDQAKFMLRRLQHDAELASCWERWQVCGDMLRGQRNALLPNDFANRVARAIDAGDAAAPGGAGATARRAGSRRLRWGGGAALAASVALLAVFAGRQAPDAALPAEGAASTPVMAASRTASMASGPMASGPSALPDAVMADAGERVPDVPAIDPSAALAVAASAVAVAEVPRRTGERRSTRAQSQRAASRIQARREASPPLLAANAGLPVLLLPGEASAQDRDHFAPPAETQVAPRPWPRALLSSTDGRYAVGLGGSSPPPLFEAFQPRDGSIAPLPPPAPERAAGATDDVPAP